MVLRGVGPERVFQLGRLGIHTVGDLLLHAPRRYEDRRKFITIRELELGKSATVFGKIIAAGVKRLRGGARSVYEFVIEDGSARLHCRWWNLPFLERIFAVGDEVMVFGKPNLLKPRTMDHPETEKVEGGDDVTVHINRVVPVYPLTEGLPQRSVRSFLWRAVEEFAGQVGEPEPRLVPVGTVEQERKGAGESASLTPQIPGSPASFPTRAEALRALHFPAEIADAERARRRLALDEFVALQLEIQRRRQNLERNARAFPCGGDNRLMKPFLAALGFKMTGAQVRVLRELRADLAGPVPMRRLLQGDVGSGKTVVAAGAALMALESGCDVALMAPTEILAAQLHRNLAGWFGPLGIAVDLRTANHRQRAASVPLAVARPEAVRLSATDLAPSAAGEACRQDAGSTLGQRAASVPLAVARPEAVRLSATDLAPSAVGEACRQDAGSTLLVGTHALLEDSVGLGKLGLVIIDEQHKFGVAQRETLLRKGRDGGRFPHLLVMTATPIPRTLGLTLYGDLDVTLLDEVPAGRGRIRTHVRDAAALPKVWQFVRSELEKGRQAYVVYPRVSESDRDEVKAVTKEFARVQQELSPHGVGLLHGQLRAEEKDLVMASFRAGTTKVLVATSVIEVGVDVPNATVMLIEDAEQFGLAQLHQLRGRIGRGAHESHCILVAEQKTDAAKARLKVLAETTDGFALAEADLRLRGPGELIGRQQSGVPEFRFGDLRGDRDLVELARALVRTHLRGK